MLASACKCLATLGKAQPAAARQLAETASIYRGWLRAPGPQAVHMGRFLFIMGQLCRYGADVLESTQAEGNGVVTMDECLSLFVNYCDDAKHGMKVGRVLWPLAHKVGGRVGGGIEGAGL